MLRSEEATEEAIKITGLYHRVWRPNAAKAAPLFVIVHGRTGTAEVMWGFTKAFERFEPVVVAPQADIHDEIGGYSWWQVPREVHAPKNVERGALMSACDKLERFITECTLRYGADGTQIHGMGFSQGAAVLASLSLREPTLLKSVACLAGFVPKAALPVISPDASVLPKYFFAHGTRDETISIERAREGADSIRALGANVEFREDDVGHKVGSTALKELSHWYDGVLGAW